MNSLVLGNLANKVKTMAPLTILNEFFEKESVSTSAQVLVKAKCR